MKTIFLLFSYLSILYNISAQDLYIPKSEIYKKDYIDFNKNGEKDLFEDATQNIDRRIDDLLSQMTIEEKTNQMVTLYGYQRVLKDALPTEMWKTKLWKDGIGSIDEHLNGFRGWGKAPQDNEYVWPASRHAWALNEVQRWFIEETWGYQSILQMKEYGELKPIKQLIFLLNLVLVTHGIKT